MKKISTNYNLLKQITDRTEGEYQIDSMQVYFYKNNNKISIISYYTKIGEVDIDNKILKLTTKKYSRTTTQQQNKIKNNILHYNNFTLENL